MNARSIGILAVVTAATVGAAFVLDKKRDSATAEAVNETALFPDLSAKINDVAKLEVASQEGSFTVARDGGGPWGLVEKAGYPVDGAKVRKLLIALKDAQVIEAKTSRPELYSKLGVEGIEEVDSPSVQVRAVDAGGTLLADLVVGNRGQNRSGNSYYVRRADDVASFLVKADLAIDKSDSTWLDKEIVDIARDEVQAVEIVHASGERVFTHKAEASATDFVLEGIPEGKELRYAGAPGSLASGMARLTMDDVRAAEDVELPQEATAITTFWTYDGFKVEASIYEIGEELLATFDAAYDEAGPPLPEGAMASEAMAGEDAGAGDAEPEADPAAVKERATALTSKANPWVYVLPSWKKSTLAKTLEELTKDIEPADEGAGLDLGSGLSDEAAIEALDALGRGIGEDPPLGEMPDKQMPAEGHDGHDHDHGDHGHQGGGVSNGDDGGQGEQ